MTKTNKYCFIQFINEYENIGLKVSLEDDVLLLRIVIR